MQLCAYVKDASRALSIKNPAQAGIASCLELQSLASCLSDSRKALSRPYPPHHDNQIEFPLLIPNKFCDPSHDSMLVPNESLGGFMQLEDTRMLFLCNNLYIGVKGAGIPRDFGFDAKIFIGPVMARCHWLRTRCLEVDPVSRVPNVFKVRKTSILVESANVAKLDDLPRFPSGPIASAALVVPSHIRPTCRLAHSHPRQESHSFTAKPCSDPVSESSGRQPGVTARLTAAPPCLPRLANVRRSADTRRPTPKRPNVRAASCRPGQPAAPESWSPSPPA